MSINRQFIKTLACIISLLFIVNISLFFYFTQQFKNKTYQSVRHTLLQERKDQLKSAMQNAYAILDAVKYYATAQTALANMRIGQNKQNRFFVIDQNGFFQLDPMRPEMVGRSYKILKRKGEIQFINKIINTSDKMEGRYINYRNPNIASGKTESELVFYKPFAKWKWIICAVTSIDDIDRAINEKTTVAQAMAFSHLKFFVISQIIALAMGLLIIMRFFKAKVVEPILELTDAATQMVDGNFENNLNLRFNREINALAEAMQLMQDSFAIAYERLKIHNMIAAAKSNNASKDKSDSYTPTKDDQNVLLGPMS